MILLTLSDIQTGLVVGGVIAISGVVLVVGSWGVRHERPPTWVARYRGFGSSDLAQMGFACAALLFGVVGMTVWVPGLELVVGVLGMAIIASLAVWLVGSVLYFPRFLLPRWYRAARRAGMNVRDPQAVQAFRDRRDSGGSKAT